MIVTTNPTETKHFQTRFLVYFKDFLKSIEIKDIVLFYTEDKLTYVVTSSNEKFIIPRTLNYLETKTDPLDFFRVNRMHLIAYSNILKIEPYFGNRLVVFLKLPINERVIVSREKVGDFKYWLNH